MPDEVMGRSQKEEAAPNRKAINNNKEQSNQPKTSKGEVPASSEIVVGLQTANANSASHPKEDQQQSPFDQNEENGDRPGQQSMSEAHGKESDAAKVDGNKNQKSDSSQRPHKLQKSHSDSEEEADEEDNSDELGNDGGETTGSVMRNKENNEPSKPLLKILKFD